jgi:hypothetical protein
MRRSRLNNLKMGFHRRDLGYEAIMTDLVLMGVIPKETFESFTGIEMADVKPPDPNEMERGPRPVGDRPHFERPQFSQPQQPGFPPRVGDGRETQ